MTERSLFIAFEGGEASGKSTQAKRLADSIDAVHTREPGGTEIGEAIRSILLDPANESLVPRTEALLMAAARAQHVEEVIRPALRQGRHVVTERYIGSSLAYQGVGRGLGVDDIGEISIWATQNLWPDITFFVDVPRDTAWARRTSSGVPNADRVESASEEFHVLVHEAFRKLAADMHWVTVDGNQDVDKVAQDIQDYLDRYRAENI